MGVEGGGDHNIFMLHVCVWSVNEQVITLMKRLSFREKKWGPLYGPFSVRKLLFIKSSTGWKHYIVVNQTIRFNDEPWRTVTRRRVFIYRPLFFINLLLYSERPTGSFLSFFSKYNNSEWFWSLKKKPVKWSLLKGYPPHDFLQRRRRVLKGI